MAIEIKKPVFRQSRTLIRDRSKSRLLVAGLLPGDIIRLRPKGCRFYFDLTIGQAYSHAVKLAAELQRRERKGKTAKKGKRR